MKLSKYLIIVLLILPLFALADQKQLRERMERRIKPVGEVSTLEQAPKAQAVTSTKIATGEKIYQTKCTICHASGVAGAPKFRDKTDWAPRADAGMDDMLKKAIAGLNAMPPKGTCMECSNEQLKAAIKYMLPK